LIMIWVGALTVPMHLGLINGPFVPHNLMSVQESPVPLPQSQMASRLKHLVPSGSLPPKKINPEMYFFLKSPSKRTPSTLPNKASMERAAHFEGLFFYTSLKFLIKIFLNKETFPK